MQPWTSFSQKFNSVKPIEDMQCLASHRALDPVEALKAELDGRPLRMEEPRSMAAAIGGSLSRHPL
jgi:hypothetical protein